MIYDREITLCTLPAGTPLQAKLVPVLSRLCAERTVFASRYWASVQAGSRVDKLVQLPRTAWDDVRAEMYAILGDGHVYRVEQAQEETEDGGCPVWVLSLRREEHNYDIAKDN